MVQIDNLRTIKTLFYLNFDPGGVSRAWKLKMKHEKITYFRHYVPWTKIPEDMNKFIDSKYSVQAGKTYFQGPMGRSKIEWGK